jgi:muramoyltetrapeptide carboxypeptidase
MNIIKPNKLKKGDTIGILAISGKINEYEKIEKAKTFFEKEGYNVVISDTCKTSHRYMSGNNDDENIKELENFFLNKEINAIIAARGGYGTLRLINKINWDIIKNNPKIFAGYSDITTLLNLIYKNTGLITFHSAMPNGDFSNEINSYTKNSFFSTLTGKTKLIKAENKKTHKEGICSGVLFGGNLTVLASLCGTNFIPKEDIILVLEDLNEPEYKIDRMLTQLFNIKEFKEKVKGIAFGEFKDIKNKEILEEIKKELTEQLNIPACSGFNITHNKKKDTIPIGIKSQLNATIGEIEILEEYVK